MAEKLTGSAIQTGTITTTQLSTSVVNNISAGGGPRVSSLIYPGDDTAANTAGGQTVYINGSGFETNNAIYINGNAVPSKSFISSSNLSFTTPALSAATYPVYVINTDTGATAIFIPGLEISGEPTWSTSATLPEQGADDTWSISLSATSDSSVTYALADGSSLPSGISLAANGLISGTLSSPPNEETTYNFTVVASDAENQDASRAFSVTVTTGEGVAFANTVLLLHADGTNNQNNHTFLDSSNNNFTITRNGNATQGSFSPFSQTGWSGYFDGNGDYLAVSSNDSAFNCGTGNFTLEFWFYDDGSSASYPSIFSSTDWSTGVGGVSIRYNNLNAANKFYVAKFANNGTPDGGSGVNELMVTSSTYASRVWHHVAFVRNGNNFRIYVNGTVGAETTSAVSIDWNLNAAGPKIGGGNWDGANSYIKGYISNLRLIKGTALYTSNFTPPTAPLTNIANTSLLTLQSNRFVDNSNNNFTITRNGDTRIVPYSPFAPTSKYTTANVGGSGYFDGTGDYLTVPSTANSAFNFNNVEWTIETWFYCAATPTGDAGLIQSLQGTNNWIPYLAIFVRNNLTVGAHINAGQYNASQTFSLHTWNHIALVRDTNGTVKLYLNGVATSVSASVNMANVNLNFWIGQVSNAPGGGGYIHYHNGYISDVRIIKGTAVYTGNFTPPTAPLTNIANTSLLCNFTNAGIFDSTAKNVLETVGGAKVSTSVVKYGTGSIDIPSTNDTVKMLGVELLADFTIEGWAKPAISGGEKFFILQGVNQTNGFLVALTTSQILWRSNGTTDISAGISKADWYHFAIVRSGSGSNNVKVYVDGSQVTQGTYTNTILASAGTLNIGPGGALNPSFASYGYIDDFRISRFARYTSNFTPPTSAFKDR